MCEEWKADNDTEQETQVYLQYGKSIRSSVRYGMFQTR
jgi:hypothetical protein